LAALIGYHDCHMFTQFTHLYVDQDFPNFSAHVPLSIKYITMRHLIYAGVTI